MLNLVRALDKAEKSSKVIMGMNREDILDVSRVQDEHCYACLQPGHQASNCRVPESKLSCHDCRVKGHHKTGSKWCKRTLRSRDGSINRQSRNNSRDRRRSPYKGRDGSISKSPMRSRQSSYKGRDGSKSPMRSQMVSRETSVERDVESLLTKTEKQVLEKVRKKGQNSP